MLIYRNDLPFITVVLLLAYAVLWNPTSVGGDNGCGRWMLEHGKSYASTSEQKTRCQIYLQRDAKIKELNELHKGTTVFAHNQFSDLTDAEMSRLHMGLLPSPAGFQASSLKRQSSSSSPILGLVTPSSLFPNPKFVNWTAVGYVSSVKNQGNCGSCWAFSAAAVVESHYAIYKQDKVLLDLSEQEILDCTKYNATSSITSDGCGGGWHYKALNYIAYVNSWKQNGVSLESGYKYKATANSKSCHQVLPAQAPLDSAFTPPVYTQVLSTDVDLQAALLNIGPLSVSVAANDFNNYRSGILWCGSRTVNHAVLVTGYSITSSNSQGPCGYYMVKNQWGTSWGMRGYVNIGFGTCGGHRANNCRILDAPLYPHML